MITKIKQLADEAIKLQNKNRMDEVLREISAMCDIDVIAVVDERIKKQSKDLIAEGLREKSDAKPLSNKSLADAIDKIPAGAKIADTKDIVVIVESAKIGKGGKK